MICALYTLSEKYANKKKYIWNINRNSMIVFARAAFRRIHIDGFVTLQEEYVGMEYMNRPIISLQQAQKEGDCIILVADEVLEETRAFLSDDKVVYWSGALGLNGSLGQEKIIIYGTGSEAEKVYNTLRREKIEIECFCVTERKENSDYKGKKIIEACELESYGDHAVIISERRPRHRMKILEIVSGFQGQVYIDIEHLLCDLYMTNIIQDFERVLKERKTVYLYSKKNIMAELIEDVIHTYDIGFGGYVYDFEDAEQGIESIYKLAYDGIEGKLIVINEGFSEGLVRARENVELAGFSLEKGNYTSVGQYLQSTEYLLKKMRSLHDPLTGYSILYTESSPGWKIYGKEDKGQIRMLVLGGSTSSEIFHGENWVSKLYYRLKKDGVDAVIYNGAHSGDDVVTELLRLLRDGYVLRPDIVISMSGVNNTESKKSDNLFNEKRLIEWVRSFSSDPSYCSGIRCKESLYSFWHRNVELMRLVAGFFGASFYGFLQPMNITMAQMTMQEKSYFDMDVHYVGSREFSHSACDNNGYINLLRIFEHQDGMYIDPCHYTDAAHKVIADKVYQAVMPEIRSLQYRKENR